MSQPTPPKKQPLAVPVTIEQAEYTHTLPICPICGAAIRHGSQIHYRQASGNTIIVHVCQRHLPPTTLMVLDPVLAAIAGNNAIVEMHRREPLLRRSGERPPLWRDAVRIKTKPAAAGQVAPIETGQDVAIQRQSAAGFWDRALGLLGELVARLFSAGESVAPTGKRVPASPSAVLGRIDVLSETNRQDRPAGNPEVVGK